MILNDQHIQILKDIHMFSRLERYHGMLPERESLIYDAETLRYLLDEGLIEQGVIMARCGNNPKGYRLSDSAREYLTSQGVDLKKNLNWEEAKDNKLVSLDQLNEEDLSTLRDFYLVTKLQKFNGLVPKIISTMYNKEVVKNLYSAGYLFYIKLKGQQVEYEKGYVLSERARRVLKQLKLVK